MDTGFLLWKTGALHGMITHMKKHFLFGLSILTALTVMDVPASDTDPADSAVSAEDLFSSDLPAGSGPVRVAQYIRRQIEEAAEQIAHEAQVESLTDTMNHTQFLLTGESEFLNGKDPDAESAYMDETETEWVEETETEPEIWPVEMGEPLWSASASGDTAGDTPAQEPQTEAATEGSAESEENAQTAETETSLPAQKRGMLTVPDLQSVNIARIHPFDYRMLRSYPLPTIPKDMHRLYDEVQELVSGFEGDWSVYVQNLSTNQTMVLNDRPMMSASVMKLYIMETVYESFENGTMPRNEDTVYLLRNMIINSSNESSNKLLRLLGGDDLAAGIAKVNDFIRRHGYTPETVIYNGFQDPEANIDPDHFNEVRARDVGQLLAGIYKREFISRKVCNEIEQMMLDQATRFKIPRGVPEGVEVGNKSGETSDTANDSAFVYSPDIDYILVVLSHGWTSENAANENVVKVSQLVYNFFC